jgi:hypothetical protein
MRTARLALIAMLLVGCGGTAATQNPGLTLRPVTPTPALAHPIASSVLNTTARPAAQEAFPPPFSGEGGGETQSFTLRGGDYAIDWTARNVNTSGVPCYFAPALQGAGYANVVGLDVDTTKQGTAYAHGLEGGQWYFDVITGCAWTLRIHR